MEPATEPLAMTLKSCPECTAQMPDSAAFCPGCGRSVQSDSVARQRRTVTRDNFLAACAYFTFLPALAFLLLDRYRGNWFVRFHSVQCLLLWLVSVAAAVLVRLLTLLLLFVPMIGRCLPSFLSRLSSWLHYSSGSFSW